MSLSITVIIIAITVIISLIAFANRKVMDDLIYYPAVINNRNQFYRFISYGFIHADLMHLIFNMYAFYLFGEVTELSFKALFGESMGKGLYVLLYVLALIVCVLPDYAKYKNNAQYRSLGASGAVSAVVFAYIILNPMQGIGLIFIPIFIPGFLFGIIYLVASYFLGKKGGSSINHNAHLWGAVFGIAFLIIASQLFSHYSVFDHFIQQVKGMSVKDLFQTY